MGSGKGRGERGVVSSGLTSPVALRPSGPAGSLDGSASVRLFKADGCRTSAVWWRLRCRRRSPGARWWSSSLGPSGHHGLAWPGPELPWCTWTTEKALGLWHRPVDLQCLVILEAYTRSYGSFYSVWNTKLLENSIASFLNVEGDGVSLWWDFNILLRQLMCVWTLSDERTLDPLCSAVPNVLVKMCHDTKSKWWVAKVALYPWNRNWAC